MMILLVASLFALLAGPLLVAAAQRREGLLAGIDALIAVAVVALVCIHILPHAVMHAGPLALLVALVGFALPVLFERSFFGSGESRLARAWTLLALIGLGLHAMVDGAALGVGDTLLGSGVVLHRITLSLLIWRLVRPRFGFGAALALVGVVGGATLLGYAAHGAGLHAHLHVDGLALLQAFVGGSIAHIAIGHARPALRRRSAGLSEQ
ncbi:MAG: hypothetical protein KC503_16220 [Myxococcales bacterium]|nr:hypothetical protein [Myxococcales bacterium]